MSSLPPIRRSIDVSWTQQVAFERFTRDFATWWSSKTHSIGGERVKSIVFEARVGGRIYEEHVDGRRFGWGEIVALDPPRSLEFKWHPSRDPATAQDVRITFTPLASGTRVELESWGWERWGKGAKTARRGYRMGWGYVLGIFSDRRTLGMRALDGVAKVLGLFQPPRDRIIAKAGGELSRE